MTDRPELSKRQGPRSRYIGIVERFGIKRSYGHGRVTLLLRDVSTAEGAVVADHLWLTRGKWAEGIMIGDRIAFNARVTEYQKGYAGERWDVLAARGSGTSPSHRLSNPTRVEVLTRAGRAVVGDDGLEPPTSSL